jgi:hypothetical protein
MIRTLSVGRGIGGGRSLAAVAACMGGPATRTGRRPDVENCRRGSNCRPDRLRIRRHVIQSRYGTYPSQSSRDRRIGLSAIGQCLKDQYDALAIPIPPHLAKLVKQLETQERR